MGIAGQLSRPLSRTAPSQLRMALQAYCCVLFGRGSLDRQHQAIFVILRRNVRGFLFGSGNALAPAKGERAEPFRQPLEGGNVARAIK